jgi:DNA uptake protein ComE-like DNA-binding protein
MATAHARAQRKADALARLSSSLGINTTDLARASSGDPDLAQVIVLERVADAVESAQGTQGADLKAAIQAASSEDLVSIPGIGEKSASALKDWAKG